MKLSISKREKRPAYVIRITILSILFSFIGQENIRVIISVKVFCYLDKLLCKYFSMKIKFLREVTFISYCALPLFLYRPVYASGCCSAADRLAGNKCGRLLVVAKWVVFSSQEACYSSTSPKSCVLKCIRLSLLYYRDRLRYLCIWWVLVRRCACCLVSCNLENVQASTTLLQKENMQHLYALFDSDFKWQCMYVRGQVCL